MFARVHQTSHNHLKMVFETLLNYGFRFLRWSTSKWILGFGLLPSLFWMYGKVCEVRSEKLNGVGPSPIPAPNQKRRTYTQPYQDSLPSTSSFGQDTWLFFSQFSLCQTSDLPSIRLLLAQFVTTLYNPERATSLLSLRLSGMEHAYLGLWILFLSNTLDSPTKHWGSMFNYYSMQWHLALLRHR